MTTLYRAAEHDQVQAGYSFAARRVDASAYLGNPGFGGSTLYRCRVEINSLIDLTDSPWDTLSEALGEVIEPSRHQYQFARTLTASDSICEQLAAKGYRWARYVDDYPEGCITYVPLTTEAAEAAEATMVEV